MTASKTDAYAASTDLPRTTWTRWRSPLGHIEAGVAVIWRETSPGRWGGQCFTEKRCHNSERNGWLLLHWQPARTVLKNYNSSELDWTGCPTTGSDVSWRHEWSTQSQQTPTACTTLISSIFSFKRNSTKENCDITICSIMFEIQPPETSWKCSTELQESV